MRTGIVKFSIGVRQERLNVAIHFGLRAPKSVEPYLVVALHNDELRLFAGVIAQTCIVEQVVESEPKSQRRIPHYECLPVPLGLQEIGCREVPGPVIVPTDQMDDGAK